MSNLIAIDAGNSHIKYGLFHNGELVDVWRHELDATEELCRQFLSKDQAPVALACVAPSAGLVLRKACEKLQRPLFHIKSSAQKFLSGMNDTMGADRVADAVAAWKFYGGGTRPVLQMGFGTATTILAISADGHVAGGWIAPGIEPTLEVLHERCQLLPLLRMEGHSDVLGFDTESHMRNGVFLGHIGMVKQWLESGQKALERLADKNEHAARRPTAQPAKPVCVATGGWSSTIQEFQPLFDHVDRHLTLRGAYLIAQEAGFITSTDKDRLGASTAS
jgi:type III pantothenate kinase